MIGTTIVEKRETAFERSAQIFRNLLEYYAMTIYKWARREAEKNPQKIAVSLNGSHLSYGKLESLSNRFAGRLLVAGLKPGDRVGILNKTPEAIIAMHGINKAGGVYVPIDVNCAADQISRTIKKADLSALIVDKATLPDYLRVIKESKELRDLPWIWWSKAECNRRGQKKYSFCLREIEQHPNYAYDRVKDDESAAVVIFKNNTAGEPQGVILNHKNITNCVNWAVSYFDMEPHDRISAYSPFHTDASILDIYGTMAAGAHLYILPDEISLAPQKLADFILEHDITQWFSSSAALNYIAQFDVIPEHGFSGLKRIIWRGEELPKSSIAYWMKRNPESSFTALFGSAETSIAFSFFTLNEHYLSRKCLPIGSPCTGVELLVLDEELNSVRDGEIGDLYVSGNGLCGGYLNEEAQRDEKFINYYTIDGTKIRIFKTGDLASFTPEGIYYYHGRSDFKAKNLGFNFDELELALSKEKKLREYALIPVRKSDRKETVLGCAFVTSDSEYAKNPPMLKQKLQKTVPINLIPEYWKCFDELPRNGKGNIDRKSLSEAFKS